jgi:hypothetical protein
LKEIIIAWEFSTVRAKICLKNKISDARHENKNGKDDQKWVQRVSKSIQIYSIKHGAKIQVRCQNMFIV